VGEDLWRVPVRPGARRIVVGNSCEKGLAPDVETLRGIQKELGSSRDRIPNLADVQAREAFRTRSPDVVADPTPGWPRMGGRKVRAQLLRNREGVRVGIPRVLTMYSVAPLFRTYFEALGVRPRNIVFSDRTSRQLYREGGTRGAIDPCFPTKVAMAHVHDLLVNKHAGRPLDLIFFPMIDDVPSDLVNALGHRICPSITATPQSIRAAFTKESDLFRARGVRYLTPFVNMGQRELFERQMHLGLRDVLGLSKQENRRAVAAGFRAQAAFESALRSRARTELDRLEAHGRVGLVLLGRPYHADRGINHDILSEFQKNGYPIFTPTSLPLDSDLLDRLFGDEVREGVITHPLDITDVWKNAYSESSNWKIWAAKFCARHPNLAAVEIGSFKCGHDSTILSVIEGILESSGTPFFYFRDLDENKPSASIRIRLETAFYFLQKHRDRLLEKPGHRFSNEVPLIRRPDPLARADSVRAAHRVR
jgi:predicted nucleotide-binding protein (sugar kinase/HSP70/actin superfamily)